MRMIDILPEHVREWVADMKARGVTPHSIRYAMVVLSAIFTTALNDQVTSLHPCKGVKTPPVPAQPRNIITPEPRGERGRVRTGRKAETSVVRLITQRQQNAS
jgi:hypothetical protein